MAWLDSCPVAHDGQPSGSIVTQKALRLKARLASLQASFVVLIV
jgi:hypothetical protein